jgi:cation diffusion facilitator family transporter
MHIHDLDAWRHDHRFLDEDAIDTNQRRVGWVIVLTAATMAAEIVAGTLTGSMALLADGWHMGTHAAALLIAFAAYRFARRHAADRRFAFGTGKTEALGGFASAILLGLVALAMIWESGERLLAPVPIRFEEALLVAVVGLAVNLASAFLLGRDDRHHGHEHHRHQDHNIKAAYLHVLADALTSVLAIVALLAGRQLGWVWLDPAAGILGALLIGRWSVGLLKDSGAVLLDGAVDEVEIRAIRDAIEADADNRVVDLHVWRVAPGRLAAIVSLVSHYPRPPGHYRDLLARRPGLVHITVEVNACGGEPCLPP